MGDEDLAVAPWGSDDDAACESCDRNNPAALHVPENVHARQEFRAERFRARERARHVVVLALREALSLGHNYIGTEHILVGLVSENEGVAARILADLDAGQEAVRTETIQLLSGAGGGRAANRPMTVGTSSPAIDRAWFGGLGVVLDELAVKSAAATSAPRHLPLAQLGLQD